MFDWVDETTHVSPIISKTVFPKETENGSRVHWFNGGIYDSV